MERRNSTTAIRSRMPEHSPSPSSRSRAHRPQTVAGAGAPNNYKAEGPRMLNSWKRILCLSVTIALASCATTSTIETNKSAAYTGLLTRLHIVVSIGDWTISRPDPQKPVWTESRLDESLAAILEKKLRDRGVTTKSTWVTELDINPSQVAADRTDFGADREMSIGLRGYASLDGKHLLKGTFDATIQDTSDLAAEHFPIVWRAKVLADGGQVYLGAMVPLPIDPEKVADTIISGLQTDGLIAGLRTNAK